MTEIEEEIKAIGGIEPTDIDSLVAEIGIELLSQAAFQTYRNASGKVAHEGDIPREFWADEINKLNPIRVYTYRANVVIVLHQSNGMEEGLYVYITISSYIPRTGDDGFTFTHLEGDAQKSAGYIHKYRRILQ